MRTAGIDISKSRLDLAAVTSAPLTWPAEARYPNDPAGRAALVAQLTALELDLVVVEATGAYHAPLLGALVAAALPVALVNPAQVRAFRQTQLGRTKTDRQDARVLAHFGATYAAALHRYTPPGAVHAALAAQVSYRDSLVAERTRVLNQQEAAAWQGQAQVQAWLATRRAQLETQLGEVEAAIAATLAPLPEAAVLQALPGVGTLVAAAVLGYLPAALWGQPKAAAAFVGVEPHLEDSGQRRRSWLSRRGHGRLRRYLYMAAVVAIRHDDRARTCYQQVRARGKSAKVALCAVMHQLLRRMMGRLKEFAATGIVPAA